jgi:exodeoxyribonuclease-3
MSLIVTYLRYNTEMKIYSWNVNGIRAVIRKELFVPFLSTESPDILCLQETKAQPEEILLSELSYHSYVNSAVKKGYSGTAILSKTVPLSVASGLPQAIKDRYGLSPDAYGDPDTEGRVITAEYQNFYVVSVYTPNAKNDLSRLSLRYDHWDPSFLAYCQELEKLKPVIFCGDLNVAHTELDLARPKPNNGTSGFTTEERAGFQNFLSAGFVDSFRLFESNNGFYTWWSYFGNAREKNIGWRIDYILISGSLSDKVTAASIHPSIFGSDHCPVSLTIDI